jgi:hypothetical protein
MPVPAQQRLRRDESMAPMLHGEQSGQRREHGAIWPGGAWPGDLPAQRGDLMSEYEDLGVLGRLAAGEQSEPGDELAEDEVEQSQRHDWRPSRTSTAEVKRRSTLRTRFRHSQVEAPTNRRLAVVFDEFAVAL